MRPLGPVDLGWLAMESWATPMNVGALMVFEIPDDAPARYVADLAASLRSQVDYAAPWNWRLRRLPSGHALPLWDTEVELDLDYHFRHLALPEPGGERELGVLVSRLHSLPLDLHRPPWEFHLIEGIAADRFGVYGKMHHSLVDGVSGMRTVLRMLNPAPDAAALKAPWTVATPTTARARRDSAPRSLLRAVRGGVAMTAALARTPNALLPSAPSSPLEHRMNQQRRFATQVVDLALVRRAADAASCTINDVVLHLCGGALRRFLLDQDQLPERPLVAAVPVNLRTPDDATVGSRIAAMLVGLGTDLEDPVQRLRTIRAETAAAKESLHRLTPAGRQATMLAGSWPVLAGQVPVLGRMVPSAFNLGISNVPGPAEPQYLGDARLSAMYPISLLMHGGALNITCVSYAGTLDFGFTGARDVLPHLQRLAVHLGDVAAELTTDLGLGEGEECGL